MSYKRNTDIRLVDNRGPLRSGKESNDVFIFKVKALSCARDQIQGLLYARRIHQHCHTSSSG